jgi:hypothetical protein
MIFGTPKVYLKYDSSASDVNREENVGLFANFN